jgi:hypothetical protein
VTSGAAIERSRSDGSLPIAQNAEQNPGKIRGDPAQNLGKIGVLTEQNQAKSRSSPEQNLA